MLITACENNNEPFKSTIIEGETILKTDSLSCFSFKSGKAFEYSTNENLIDDFWLGVYRNELGDLMGIGFITEQNSKRFDLIDNFESVDSANEYFENISNIKEDDTTGNYD